MSKTLDDLENRCKSILGGLSFKEKLAFKKAVYSNIVKVKTDIKKRANEIQNDISKKLVNIYKLKHMSSEAHDDIDKFEHILCGLHENYTKEPITNVQDIRNLKGDTFLIRLDDNPQSYDKKTLAEEYIEYPKKRKRLNDINKLLGVKIEEVTRVIEDSFAEKRGKIGYDFSQMKTQLSNYIQMGNCPEEHKGFVNEVIAYLNKLQMKYADVKGQIDRLLTKHSYNNSPEDWKAMGQKLRSSINSAFK